jgi:hypothetical protein
VDATETDGLWRVCGRVWIPPTLPVSCRGSWSLRTVAFKGIVGSRSYSLHCRTALKFNTYAVKCRDSSVSTYCAST